MKALSILALIALPVLSTAEKRISPPPALQATFERTVQSPGGGVTTSSGIFYRDAQGRTRLELGKQVYIQDPSSGVSGVLDLETKVAHLTKAAPLAKSPASVPQSQGVVFLDARSDLGSKIIDGNAVTGERHSVHLPPDFPSSTQSVTITTETWQAFDLRLPVLVKVTDSRYGETTTAYRDIVLNAPLDPKLFEIPTGFQIVDSSAR
jgi:hypothetical protein